MYTSRQCILFKLLRICAAALFCAAAFLPQNGPIAQAGNPPAGGGSFMVNLIAPAQLPQDQIPLHLSDQQAREVAWGMVQANASDLIRDLKELQSQGKIESFTLKPDQFAIEVRGAGADLTIALAQNQAAGQVYPSGDAAPGCVRKSNQALVNQVQAISRTSPTAHRAAKATAATAAASPFDPVGNIEVYYWPEGSSYVQGLVPFKYMAVNVEVYRAGLLIGKKQAWADSFGFYDTSYYYSYGCDDTFSDWSAKPGDEVHTLVGGAVYIYTVQPMNTWADPVANTVSGVTALAPGRWIDVILVNQNTSPCVDNVTRYAMNLDAAGNFSGAVADFNRSAYVLVHAREANNNSTFTYRNAYQLRLQTDSSPKVSTNYANGTYRPFTDVTFFVTRGSSTLEQVNLNTGETGSFVVELNNALQANDTIYLFEKGSPVITFTLSPVTYQITPTADKIAGTALPGRLVAARAYHTSYPNNPLTCDSNSSCAYTFAAANGAYDLPLGWNMVSGDYAYLAIFDAERNLQEMEAISTPTLIADLNYNNIEGVWSNPDAALTLKLYNSQSALIKTYENVYIGSRGFFSVYLGYDSTNNPIVLHPGDKIEASDGTNTRTLIIQAFTARMATGAAAVTGSSPAGTVIAEVRDFRRDSTSRWYYCTETSGGTSYSAAVNLPQPFSGQDYGTVTFRDAVENYEYRDIYTFTVNATLNAPDFNGHTETPAATVTLKHFRSGAVISTKSGVSGNSGYFSLASGTNFIVGDALVLTTSDGSSATVIMQPISASLDKVNNLVYGKAPANNPVRVRIRRYYGSSGSANSWYTTLKTNGTGDFQWNVSGLKWSHDCSPVLSSNPCVRPGLEYYDLAGHDEILNYPIPPAIAADGFENDDASASAKPYQGLQSHTFHTTEDVDWVSFVVTQNLVGATYRIQLVPTGWYMHVNAELQNASGNYLDSHSFWEDSANIWGYQFSQAGTYKLKITPGYAADDAGGCDSAYTLQIKGAFNNFIPSVAK